MSKITKKELQRAIQRQESRIDGLVGLLAKKGYYDKEPEPQLKQLDQSIFDGLDEKWRFAAIDEDGHVGVFDCEPAINCDEWYEGHGQQKRVLDNNYDASNWQNSLIERDITKELTGSELCRAMLERGDNYVMCFVSGMSDDKADSIPKAITSFNSLTEQFRANHDRWQYAVPINNMGEPLTASEVGL